MDARTTRKAGIRPSLDLDARCGHNLLVRVPRRLLGQPEFASATGVCASVPGGPVGGGGCWKSAATSSSK